jgi:hypothetical protein
LRDGQRRNAGRAGEDDQQGADGGEYRTVNEKVGH